MTKTSSGAGGPDPATDVFAWAEVVVLAGSGHLPFPRAGPARRSAVVSGSVDLRGLPPVLRPLVRDALAPDPVLRPSPAALLERLAAAEDAGPTSGTMARLGVLLTVTLVGQGWLWGWWGSEGVPQARAIAMPAAAALLLGGWFAVRRVRRRTAGGRSPGPIAGRCGGSRITPRSSTRRFAVVIPLAVVVVTALPAWLTLGAGYGVATRVVLAIATALTARDRATWATRPWLLRGHRPAVATALGLGAVVAAAVRLAGAAGHGVAGSCLAVAVATALGWFWIGRAAEGGRRPLGRPLGRRLGDVPAAVAVAVCLTAAWGDLGGGLGYAAATLASGFSGSTLRNIPSSDEIYALLPSRVDQAWLALGIPLALRHLLATMWAGRQGSEGRPAPGAAAREHRARRIGALAVTLLVAAFVVDARTPDDPCDGHLGRRQRTLELRLAGAFGEPRYASFPDGRTRVALVWAASPGCAWGRMVTAVDPAEVWLERRGRDDGPSTRFAHEIVVGVNYTGTYGPAGGALRACGKSGRTQQCTDWFSRP